MYNPNSKIRLLLLSSIRTMLAEIQGENKQKQKMKRSEAMVKLEFQTAILGLT
jgi:hypothetical protein